MNFNNTMQLRFKVISLYKKNISVFDDNTSSTLEILIKSALLEDLNLANEIIKVHLLAI